MNKIIKYILILVVSLFAFLNINPLVKAEEITPVNLYLFYGEGCPHCSKERAFLEKAKERYGDKIVINEYEIYYNYKNASIFMNTVKRLNINNGGVPLLVFSDDKFISGYGIDATTGVQITSMIEGCLKDGCDFDIEKVFHPEEITKDSSDILIKDSITEPISETNINDNPIMINTYLFGNIDLKKLSLPVATAVIALVDGFNPCAMWILIFLITMLINMKDRKKLYILGSVFIIASGLVYLVFLAAWFNFFKFIGYVYWIKVIIGVVAIVSGIMHIKSALFSKGGCKATNETQRETIMMKIKRTLDEKNFLLSIIGIITLAISVNLIEVVCSAGLPAVYTSLLSTINLSTFEYYSYLLFYVFIFMIDDLLIFFIAIKTFEVTGIAKKYTTWSSLVGGIIILIIGIILISKPELLMFG